MNTPESSAWWRKSSYSNGQTNCVEVAAQWRTSSYSQAQGNNCVEVADNLPGRVAVRDSKNRSGPSLVFTPTAWRSFLRNLS